MSSASPGVERTRWMASTALFVPLLLLLVVAARTWSAERRYAAVTHKVVQDYAGIAAWQYARTANMVLHDEAMRAFSGISKGHQRTGAASPLDSPEAILAPRATTGSVVLDNARFAFTWDAASSRITSAGGVMTDDTRLMLERRLREIAQSSEME